MSAQDREAEEKITMATELCTTKEANVADLKGQLAAIQEKLDQERAGLAEAEATLASLQAEREATVDQASRGSKSRATSRPVKKRGTR